MAGIYIHIPFCKQACTYCDFHFITSLKRKKEMVAAIAQEVSMRKNFFGKSESISSIYFGGGTPSILDLTSLGYILDHLHENFDIHENAEITLEANPDDLVPQKLEGLSKLGFNRLSIGIQSLIDSELQWMNRSHTAEEALKCITYAKEAGFTNMSVDVIFGTPYATLETLSALLSSIIQLKVPHISVYALTVEEKTVLAYWLAHDRISLPEDDVFERQFLLVHEILTHHGYNHYELSNYALPGMQAVHNSSYWKGQPYLGIGPSAHAYDGIHRMANVSNNSKYIQALSLGNLAIDYQEELSSKDRYHEYIMTQLRKSEGLDTQFVQQTFGVELEGSYQKELNEWITKGYMRRLGHQLTLTPKGWITSDAIIRTLFI